MLIEYMERLRYQMENAPPYGNLRLVCAPATVAQSLEDCEFEPNSNFLRILMPAGSSSPSNLGVDLEKWGKFLVQQLPRNHMGVYGVRTRPFAVEKFQDYDLALPGGEVEPEVLDYFQRIAPWIEKQFGDTVTLKVARYRSTFFVFEIGPTFLYQEESPEDYWSLFETAEISPELLMKKVYNYASFLPIKKIPLPVVERVSDWLRYETGAGCFVGEVYRSGMLQSKCRPNATLYQIASPNAVPGNEPFVDHVAFYFPAEFVASPDFWGTCLNLLGKVSSWESREAKSTSKWKHRHDLTVFYGGIYQEEQFTGIMQKLRAVCDVRFGVSVSSWGQLLRLESNLKRIVEPWLLDWDTLSQDGALSPAYGCNEAMLDIIQEMLPEYGSLLTTRDIPFKDLAEMCRHFDSVYTDIAGFSKSVFGLGVAKTLDGRFKYGGKRKSARGSEERNSQAAG